MATADASQPDESRTTPLVTLATLALLAGAGGMAVSFLFLASRSHLDVIAGAVGFIAGGGLVAAGRFFPARPGRVPADRPAGKRAARGARGRPSPPLCAP